MDILTNVGNELQGYAYALPAPVYAFLLRANIILMIPTLIAYAGFRRGVRNATYQSLLILIGIIAGFSIPIDDFISPNAWRPWLVAFLLIGVLYLPAALSFLSEPRLGHQLKLRRRIRIGLVILFLINLIWS